MFFCLLFLEFLHVILYFTLWSPFDHFFYINNYCFPIGSKINIKKSKKEEAYNQLRATPGTPMFRPNGMSSISQIGSSDIATIHPQLQCVGVSMPSRWKHHARPLHKWLSQPLNNHLLKPPSLMIQLMGNFGENHPTVDILSPLY